MLFDEEDFIKRLRRAISEAWKIFRFKVGNGIIKINKEASMQLLFTWLHTMAHDDTTCRT
jgi:hydroxypyruvate isomerase